MDVAGLSLLDDAPAVVSLDFFGAMVGKGAPLLFGTKWDGERTTVVTYVAEG
jgi:hypothetical protein